VNPYCVQHQGSVGVHVGVGRSGWSDDPMEGSVIEGGPCDCISNLIQGRIFIKDRGFVYSNGPGYHIISQA